MKTFVISPLLLLRQDHMELIAPFVEQQRVLAKPLRKYTLGQSMHEHHVEGSGHARRRVCR
jgi:hypothetical protein